VLFALAGVIYSVYWVLDETAPGPAAWSAYLLGVVFGIGGAAGQIAGIGPAEPGTSTSGRLGLRYTVGACAALLIVTYAVTTIVFDRVFTAELVFVMGWATIELCSLHDARRRRWIQGRRAVAATVLVVLALAFGLACYTVYFLLEGRARFYAGLVPYGVVSLVMLLVAMLLLPGGKDAGALPQRPSRARSESRRDSRASPQSSLKSEGRNSES
jgi:hypothetical protein